LLDRAAGIAIQDHCRRSDLPVGGRRGAANLVLELFDGDEAVNEQPAVRLGEPEDRLVAHGAQDASPIRLDRHTAVRASSGQTNDPDTRCGPPDGRSAVRQASARRERA
jgi:hypothetical protein